MNNLLKMFACLLTAASFVLGSVATASAGKRGVITGIIGVGIGAVILNELAKQNDGRARAHNRGAVTSADYERNRDIQLSLNKLGYNVGSADGVIGPRTRSQISRWQIANGYEGTGTLSKEQFNVLTADVGIYSAGASGANSGVDYTNDDHLAASEIRLLQTSLNRLGYPAGSADGKMGRGTNRALSMFLEDSGNDPETTSLYQALVEATEMAGVEYDGRGRGLSESADQPVTSTLGSEQSLPENEKALSTAAKPPVVEEKSSDETALEDELSQLEKTIADLQKANQE